MAQALIALDQAERSVAFLSVIGVLLVIAASFITRSSIGNVKKAGVTGGVGKETSLMPVIVSSPSTVVVAVASPGFTPAAGVGVGVVVVGSGVTG